jgi:predicted aldo/keto reductase-like oxidoreductase
MSHAVIEEIVFLILLVGLSIPLGIYIDKTMSGQKVFLTKVFTPVERGIYKLMGVQQEAEMTAKQYAVAVLLFSGIGFVFLFLLELLQNRLPLNDWDFCMIQYNYMDEYSQVGKKGLLAAKEKGIPVMIMEPLRGGKLVSLLPQGAKKIIEEHPKKRSPAEWAFRWLWNQGEVTTVLSGMNSVEMVQENVRIASEVQVGEFDGEDFNLVDQIKAEINTAIKVNCTGCAYCMPCPKGVDIPGAFRCYNLKYTEGKRTAIKEYAMVTAARKEPSNASNCIGCGKCEQHCPQEIPIRQELKKASKELETPGYKAFKLGYRIIKPW